MDRIRTAITVSGLESYLNCNRVQAQQLTRQGILPSLLPRSEKGLGAFSSIAREDADEFLAKLMGAAEAVPVVSEGMLDIIAAAELSRWPAMDIVRGILSGLFAKVEIVDADLKFKGVLVHPLEVRQVLQRNQVSGYVGIEDAVTMIGMPQQGLNNLVRMCKPDGSPYLVELSVKNAKGKPVRLFSMNEIHAFREEHISLKDIAEAETFSPKVMKMKLDGRGLLPVGPKYELGRLWYRREDLVSN